MLNKAKRSRQPRKGNNKRRRNGQSGNAAAAVATSRTTNNLRATIVGDIAYLEFEELLMVATLPSTTSPPQSAIFLPGNSGCPRLDAFAALYDYYNVEKFEVVYAPAVGTSTSGAMVVAIDYDAGDIPPNWANTLSIIPRMTGGVWQQGSINVPVNRLNKQPWMLTNSGITGVNDQTGAGAAAACAVYFHGTGSNGSTVGDVWVRYRIKFMGPTVPTPAQMAVDPAAGATYKLGQSVLPLGAFTAPAVDAAVENPGACMRVNTYTVVNPVDAIGISLPVDSTKYFLDKDITKDTWCEWLLTILASMDSNQQPASSSFTTQFPGVPNDPLDTGRTSTVSWNTTVNRATARLKFIARFADLLTTGDAVNLQPIVYTVVGSLLSFADASIQMTCLRKMFLPLFAPTRSASFAIMEHEMMVEAPKQRNLGDSSIATLQAQIADLQRLFEQLRADEDDDRDSSIYMIPAHKPGKKTQPVAIPLRP